MFQKCLKKGASGARCLAINLFCPERFRARGKSCLWLKDAGVNHETRMLGLPGASCMNRASVFEWHKRFKESRESERDDERWGKSWKSIHLSWLAKGLGLGLGLQYQGFKGVQEEIPSEDASTLQIGSVVFPLGQCTSPQLHPCRRLFNQDGHQDSSLASLLSRPCFRWLLVIPQSSRKH